MIYSIPKRFLNEVMSRQQVCIAIFGNLDGVAQPVGDLLNTDESGCCEQRRKRRSHSLDGQPFHSVRLDVLLKGPPHVIPVTIGPTFKLLGMQKIRLTGRKLRKVAFEELCGLFRHRNYTFLAVLDSKVAEWPVWPDEVAHAQDPLLQIDPTWQGMVDLSAPQPEVKPENQEELEMIVLGNRDEPVALVVGRESAIRSRLRLFDYHIDRGIVRDLPRAVRPTKQARNAREVSSGGAIKDAGTLGVIPFLKIPRSNCTERFCDSCDKALVNVTMTPLGRRFPFAFPELLLEKLVHGVPKRLRFLDERVDRDLTGGTNRLRKIRNGPAFGIGQRDKMPLAAVHLHVIILLGSHVHVRHTSRSPGIPLFAVPGAWFGGLVHGLGLSQICVTNRKFFCRHMLAQQSKSENGVLAQSVERLNGIEEVRGSNPLGSKSLDANDLRVASDLVSMVGLNDALAKGGAVDGRRI